MARSAKLPRGRVLFLPLGFIVLVAVLGVTIYGVHARTAAHITKTPALAITHSTNTPSEVKPTAKTFQWTGRASDPEYITISRVGIAGYIQNVGVDQNTQVGVPDNIYLAGWFVNSVQPGQLGLSVIDGHVDGHRNLGIFYNLAKVQTGDTVTIKQGGGATVIYHVFNVTTVKTADAPSVLFSQDPTKKHQLNLITCGGTYDSAAAQYQDRVVVSAAME